MAVLLYLEDLLVGQSWCSPFRSIVADDVRRFSELTGDYTPLHEEPQPLHGASTSTDGQSVEVCDDEMPDQSVAGQRSPFGRPVAHGLLGLAILAGLSSEHPRVSTLALIEIGDWKFHHPIYFGETVYAETEIISIKPHGRRAGKVLWHRRLRARDKRLLQSGTIETIVARRYPLKRCGMELPPTRATTPSQVVSG